MAKELRFPNINTIVISGRLTRDVELRYLQNGTPIAKLSIAFNRNYQKNGEWHQETSFIDVVVWSKRGEQCAEYLHKGSPVIIEGYLRTHSYVDKNDQNRKVTEVIAGKVSFLEKDGYNTNDDYSKSDNTDNSKDKPDAEVTDDDVPF
ncbi:MAG: single-stranded DNA-binding protein [Candidatus Cloacimonetes bacterium]|nr:single-stranded DNA-binding protein [Candidatus Cloacimonadota bacterium]